MKAVDRVENEVIANGYVLSALVSILNDLMYLVNFKYTISSNGTIMVVKVAEPIIISLWIIVMLLVSMFLKKNNTKIIE